MKVIYVTKGSKNLKLCLQRGSKPLWMKDYSFNKVVSVILSRSHRKKNTMIVSPS